MSITVTVEKVGAAFALIKCHHRPEAEYEFTGEFLGLSHELKFVGKNLRELRDTGCSIYDIYQEEYGMTLLPDYPGIKLAEILATSHIGLNKFSVYLGCCEQEIVELLTGALSLTKAMALRLSHVVGGSWSQWMLIQEQFELQLAQREIKELMILTNLGDEIVGL